MLRTTILSALFLLWLTPRGALAASIDIIVQPNDLVLGESTAANVTVRIAPRTGQPCEDMRIHVSTGSISNIKYELSGNYTATFNLPTDFYPRFALLGAAGTCSGKTVTGIAVVKLFGTGDVVVKSKPFSRVTLQIGDQIFGPATTNKFGKATIPIVVGPGIRSGLAANKVIDLNLPSVNRILAISDRPEISADLDEKSPGTIWIYAIDELGTPLKSADFEVSAVKGTVPSIDIVAPGVYRAHYVPPQLIGDGAEKVTFNLKGDLASVDDVDLTLVPGVAEAIAIEPSSKAYTAGTGEPLVVSATVLDKNGNPTPGEVSLTTSFGDVSEPQREAPGVFSATLAVPDRFDGAHDTTLSASLRENKAVTTSLTIPLVPAHPKRIEFHKPTDPVPADGYTTIRIPLSIEDKFNNPVPDLSIAVAASRGSTPTLAVPDGDHYHIPFTPPLGRGSGTVDIEVTERGLASKLEIPLSDKIYTVAAELVGGYQTNFVHLHAPAFQAELDVSLWFLFPGFHALIDVGYYYSKSTLDSESYTSTMSAVPIILSIGYRYHISPRLHLALSVGLGVQIMKNKNEGPDNFEYVEAAAEVGVQTMLAAGFRAGPGHIVTKAGYVYAKPSNIALLSGSAGGLSILLGYRYAFTF